MFPLDSFHPSDCEYSLRLITKLCLLVSLNFCGYTIDGSDNYGGRFLSRLQILESDKVTNFVKSTRSNSEGCVEATITDLTCLPCSNFLSVMGHALHS